MNVPAGAILTARGCEHSKVVYRRVARNVPEAAVCRALSERKEGGAESAAKVFMCEMVAYAEGGLASGRCRRAR